MKKLPVESGQCYFFEDRLNRRYISGVDIAEGYFIYSENPVYFTDLRYFAAAKEKLKKAGIAARVYKTLGDIAEEVNRQHIKTAFMDYSATSVSRFRELEKTFGEIKDCSDLLLTLRIIKTEEEIESIKKACKITEKAVKETFLFAKEGITEKELLKILEDKIFALGGETAFDTIVAFGKNSAVPHHETGTTKLKIGDAILIDTGAKINGYCADITRTAFFGKPDKEFLKIYNAVLSANIKAEKEIYAGISGKAADKIARDELSLHGYGEYFTHSLGHGVGLEIHENPRLSLASDDILAVNTVFTVEPGVYIDGKVGVRIEDTCVMTENGALRLFKDDKKLRVISR